MGVLMFQGWCMGFFEQDVRMFKYGVRVLSLSTSAFVAPSSSKSYTKLWNLTHYIKQKKIIKTNMYACS